MFADPKARKKMRRRELAIDAAKRKRQAQREAAIAKLDAAEFSPEAPTAGPPDGDKPSAAQYELGVEQLRKIRESL
jgi:hypothetical protein